MGEEAVTYSIETTYFHSASTDFHKLCDLLWEQRVVSSNLTAPTNVLSALQIGRLDHPLISADALALKGTVNTGLSRCLGCEPVYKVDYIKLVCENSISHQ